jgi:PIN domain nuclease of toxin-antitoxin system
LTVILDASALLAALLDEPGGEIVRHAFGDSLMSVVNVAEVVERLTRGGHSPAAVERIISTLQLHTEPPDLKMAVEVGAMRAVTGFAGLSLGDRFCLSLARKQNAPVLTADRNWSRVAEIIDVEVRLIR